MAHDKLVGIGLYTPAEAGRLIDVRAARLTRWLRGHDANGHHYEPLWTPQVDLGDGHIYLGFRDLMEARVADALIRAGLSAQKVRRAIQLACNMVGEERPLSTTRFRTDGRRVFLEMADEEQDRLIDLFSKQYQLNAVVEPSLRNIEFDEEGIPARWWPRGKTAGVVLDPTRSFGQPIEVTSSVPVAVLAAAADAEGSVEAAARAWDVSTRAIRSALRFRDRSVLRQAA